MTSKVSVRVSETIQMRQSIASVEVTGRLPSRLDASLAEILSGHVGKGLTGTTIRSLGTRVRARASPSYDEDWVAFNYLYYPANFLKSLLAARSLATAQIRKTFTLLDLGCGGGASTAGFISGMELKGLQPTAITVVDCCAAQLDLFKFVTAPWLKSVSDIETNVIVGDIAEACRGITEVPDFVLLSYALGEMASDEQIQLRTFLRQKFTSNGCTVIVIDSDPDGRGVCVELLGEAAFVVPYDNVIFHCPRVVGLGLDIAPKFSAPRTADDIVRKYAECWKDHDLDALNQLFAPDCHYHINGDKVLEGIGAIREYWQHNAATQRNVTFSHTTLSETADRIILSWQASFTRVDTRDHRSLTGIMILEIEHGMICMLCEYYSQRREPLLFAPI